MKGFAIGAFLAVCLAHSVAVAGPGGTVLQRGFDDDYVLLQKRGEGLSPTTRAREVERAWAAFESLPETFPEAKVTPELRSAFDRALYRRAASMYRVAAAHARNRQRYLDETERLKLLPPRGPWWQMIDRNSALDRVAGRARDRYTIDVADNLRNAIDTLDSISREQLRNDPSARGLRQLCLRRYALERLRLDDPLATLRALNRYRQDPTAEGEWPLHYFLSAAYDRVFRSTLRDRGMPEAELRKLRRKKNLHFLRAVELRYGLHSREYEHVWRRVRMDELGPPRSPR